MDIVQALKQEEAKLHRQLTSIQGALAVLNGGSTRGVSSGHAGSPKAIAPKRTMSAAVRARISQKAKARWAKIRAEQSKGKKAK
jgi:hypothetical protein